MIETLISSKTRVKLLMKFFLNSNTVAYLRGLEAEFGESTNAIRVELNKMEEANMLRSYTQGNKKFFKANKNHPLFNEIHNILRKHIGLDAIIEHVVARLGDVQSVFLAGDFAQGKDSPIIDLIFIGDVDTSFLVRLIAKTEELIHRKIRYLIYSSEEEVRSILGDCEPEPLLLWTKS